MFDVGVIDVKPHLRKYALQLVFDDQTGEEGIIVNDVLGFSTKDSD